jgi:predicted transcriptional regulator
LRIIAPTEQTRVITARLAPELAERLARAAAEEDRSQSAIVRRAVRSYLGGQAPVRIPENDLKEAA